MQNIQGKWAGRFIWASVTQGLIAVIVTVLIIDPTAYFNGTGMYYSASRVIAANGAGTWLFTGYVLYLVVGVVASAVTAIFYFYLEGIQGKVYKGIANILAWGHIVFMNIGVAGSMLLMMWGGYRAGVAAANNQSAIIHPQILGPLTDPIGGLVLLAALGALLGGLGFIIRSRQH
jgi:hypothetical protein